MDVSDLISFPGIYPIYRGRFFGLPLQLNVVCLLTEGFELLQSQLKLFPSTLSILMQEVVGVPYWVGLLLKPGMMLVAKPLLRGFIFCTPICLAQVRLFVRLDLEHCQSIQVGPFS